MIKSKTIINRDCVSPDFIYDVKPEIMLQIIDGFIGRLLLDTKPETIFNISTELSTFQILNFNYNNNNLWISQPITINKNTVYYPFKNRIFHFMKSFGKWNRSIAHKDTVKIHSEIKLPIYANVDSITYDKIKHNNHNSMIHSLVKIHHIITQEIQKGSKTIGVFKNADIVKNLEYMREWLNHYEDEVYWGLEKTIRTIDLNSVVHNVIIRPYSL